MIRHDGAPTTATDGPTPADSEVRAPDGHEPAIRAAPATPRRRMPKWSDVVPLVALRRPTLDGTERRLERASTVADLRVVARRRAPRAVFDYVDGGAERELSLRRCYESFARVEFRPSVLRDVSAVDTGAQVLGKAAALPIALAPTGFTRLMHHEGESAVYRAAAAARLPYALSTMGTTSIEALAAAAPEARRWFQLYLWRDRDHAADLVRRAQDAGYEALVVTVDCPVPGSRLRDVRNGMTIPPSLTISTLANALSRPTWWFNFLTTPPLEFASLSSWGGTVAELASQLFDPSVTLRDIDWLRQLWPGKLVIKGVQTAADAARLAEQGADALVLSNHGGRQLDRSTTPLEELPAVVAAVDDRVEVMIDGGITSGSDVVAALCLGASSVLIGRAYLFGLMAGGERGVGRALEILAGEVRQTMQLLGVTSVDQLNGDLARLRPGS